jgi:nucleoside 2-deoxyribosyltransferase
MPFSKELIEVYEDCIKIAVHESKMECKRADNIFHNSSIVEVIWTEICSAEVIIADLTGKNPNVFYELGIAHTLGKETIMITQNRDDVPFDLRHLRYIEYSNTGRGLQELKKQLILTIGSIRGSDTTVTVHN